jgi:site-specific recombinase XerD
MPDDEYQKYERTCKRIKKDNAKLLEQFDQWLSGKGLADKTVRRHVENADFYINTFLLYEDAIPAKDGASHISMFLGYWFIRKAMWASPSAIRENAASLKKFYTYMQEQGQIDTDKLQDLKETIKEEMPDWVGTVERYDDPDITDPEEIWGL